MVIPVLCNPFLLAVVKACAQPLSVKYRVLREGSQLLTDMYLMGLWVDRYISSIEQLVDVTTDNQRAVINRISKSWLAAELKHF